MLLFNKGQKYEEKCVIKPYRFLKPVRFRVLRITSEQIQQGEICSIYSNDILLHKTARMKSLSLKLEEDIFEETERILESLPKSRNRYINEALQFYNLLQRRKMLAAQLDEESMLVSEESLSVLAEFEALENED